MSGENQGAQGVTLEVGKTYITRDGSSRVRIIDRRDSPHTFPMVGEVLEGFVISPIFTAAGFYAVPGDGEYKHDLVREIQEGEALPPLSPPATADAQEAEQSGLVRELVEALRVAVQHIPLPDHVGSLDPEKASRGIGEAQRLSINSCACALHEDLRVVYAALAKAGQ